MHRFLSILSILALAAGPVAAHSSELITLNLTSGGTYNITVPSGTLTPPAETPPNSFPDSFNLTNLTVTGPSYSSNNDTVLFFDSTSNGGGGLFDPALPGSLNFETGTGIGSTATFIMTQMFLGSITSPSFVPGTGNITFDGGITNGGSYSITNIAATATPEPSSLLLLATGAVVVVGSTRRRILCRV